MASPVYSVHVVPFVTIYWDQQSSWEPKTGLTAEKCHVSVVILGFYSVRNEWESMFQQRQLQKWIY